MYNILHSYIIYTTAVTSRTNKCDYSIQKSFNSPFFSHAPERFKCLHLCPLNPNSSKKKKTLKKQIIGGMLKPEGTGCKEFQRRKWRRNFTSNTDHWSQSASVDTSRLTSLQQGFYFGIKLDIFIQLLLSYLEWKSQHLYNRLMRVKLKRTSLLAVMLKEATLQFCFIMPQKNFSLMKKCAKKKQTRSFSSKLWRKPQQIFLYLLSLLAHHCPPHSKHTHTHTQWEVHQDPQLQQQASQDPPPPFCGRNITVQMRSIWQTQSSCHKGALRHLWYVQLQINQQYNGKDFISSVWFRSKPTISKFGAQISNVLFQM